MAESANDGIPEGMETGGGIGSMDGVENDSGGYAKPVTKRKRSLSFLPLVAIIFYEVCGGPYGIEDSVREGGALAALIGLLVFPWIWSVPEALITAELATMFPEDSGYVAWISAAFGPFWGFQEGYLSWVSGVMDNSIYPLYAIRYLKDYIPLLKNFVAEKVFFVVASAALTFLNYMGLVVVGRTAVLMAVMVLFPFIIMFFMALPMVQPSELVQFDANHFKENFWEFMNVMFWNLNYWDSVSTLAGEVKNPGKNFPRAMYATVVLVVLAYFIPLFTALGVLGSEDIPEGLFLAAGKKVGGPVLGALILISACSSLIGLFEAEMSSDSFQILGMSERGMLPRFMGIVSKHGTPTVGILMSSLGVIFMLVIADFELAIEWLNYAYCLGVLLEFAAFIYLRVKAPEARRPYKVPLSTLGCVLMVLPGTALISILVITPWIQLNFGMIIFNLTLISSGIGFYFLLGWLRKIKPHWFTKYEPFDLNKLLKYQTMNNNNNSDDGNDYASRDENDTNEDDTARLIRESGNDRFS